MVNLQALITRSEAIYAASATFTHWEVGDRISKAIGPILTAGLVAALACLVENRIHNVQGTTKSLPSLGDVVMRAAAVMGGTYAFGIWPPGKQISASVGTIPIIGAISFLSLLLEDRIKSTDVSRPSSGRRFH